MGANQMQKTEDNSFTWEKFFLLCLFIFLVLTIYFIPTYIAIRRNLARRWLVLIVNLISGWTVIGWVAAIVWACLDKKIIADKETSFEIIDDYHYSDDETFALQALERFKLNGQIPQVGEGSLTIKIIDNYVKTHGVDNRDYREARKNTMAAVKKYESHRYEHDNDAGFAERALERYQETGELPAAREGSLTSNKIASYISIHGEYSAREAAKFNLN
jgi:hypothetical protein